MITLMGSLLGFIGAFMPELFKWLQGKADRKHELAILALQIRQQEKGRAVRLEEIQTQFDIKETAALYKTYRTGIFWVDALNGTVRPVLAYAFFLLYAVVKYGQFDQNLTLWSEEDQAIFAAIISFYYGQRAFRRA